MNMGMSYFSPSFLQFLHQSPHRRVSQGTPRKCLGDDTKVLLLGDSTTHGLLQEALTMWSEVKPYINGLNKSHSIFATKGPITVGVFITKN